MTWHLSAARQCDTALVWSTFGGRCGFAAKHRKRHSRGCVHPPLPQTGAPGTRVRPPRGVSRHRAASPGRTPAAALAVLSGKGKGCPPSGWRLATPISGQHTAEGTLPRCGSPTDVEALASRDFSKHPPTDRSGAFGAQAATSSLPCERAQRHTRPHAHTPVPCQAHLTRHPCRRERSGPGHQLHGAQVRQAGRAPSPPPLPVTRTPFPMTILSDELARW